MAGFIPRKYKRGATKRVYKTAARIGDKLKKRYVSGSSLNLSKVSKDVAMLKALMNVEKKRIDLVLNSVLLGQVSANLTGTQVVDITPIVVQGIGYNQRDGSSLKIVSAYMKFQFWSQASNNHPMKIRMEFWKIKGVAQTVTQFLTDMYVPSTASGVIDYNSLNDPTYRGQATKFYSKDIVFPANSYAGQILTKEIAIPLKMQHHIRYDYNTTTVDDGQMLLVFRCDSGNYGLTSTLPNIPITTSLSGVIFNQDIRYYYVDN